MASGHNIIYLWQNESIGPKLFRQSDLYQDSDIKQCIIGNIMIEKNYFIFSRLWRIDMDGWGKQIPWYQILQRWIKFPWCTFPMLSSSCIINTDPTTIECFSQEAVYTNYKQALTKSYKLWLLAVVKLLPCSKLSPICRQTSKLSFNINLNINININKLFVGIFNRSQLVSDKANQ